MLSRYSFTCAYANVSSAGNINATEIFSDIAAQSFPCSPRLMYVACTAFEPREAGSHKFRLTVTDSNGIDVIKPIIGDIGSAPNSPNANLIINFAGLSFPKPDTYQIDLSVDGVHLNTDVLRLAQANVQ